MVQQTWPLDGSTVVLVGCGDSKREGTHLARDLYNSGFFSLKRQFAEEIGDVWYVLSAEHGLLSPSEPVEDYDTAIKDVDGEEWEARVREALPPLTGARVVVLAGPDYLEAGNLAGTLRMYADVVETPTAGMRIHDRMSWLSDRVDDVNDQEDRADHGETPAPNAVADGPTFRCEDCGNVVQDAPARITTCLDCGGDMAVATSASVEPERPDAATYVLDGLDRQDAETLRDLADYGLRRAAWLDHQEQQDIDEPPEIDDDQEFADDVEIDVDVEDVEDLEDVPSDARANVYPIKIPCGKDCDGCPHGPYLYAKWREGDTVHSKYVGPA